jgi:hypothetical protein
MTLTHDRFQITCTLCGFIASEKSLSEAIKSATYYNEKHFEPNEFIEIFDSMTHHGKPELYTYDGKVIRNRA